jgi:hypothetical protein
MKRMISMITRVVGIPVLLLIVFLLGVKFRNKVLEVVPAQVGSVLQ